MWVFTVFISLSRFTLLNKQKNGQTMKEEIVCLTEIMDGKSICADVSYKWHIIVYKHLEDLPDTSLSFTNL